MGTSPAVVAMLWDASHARAHVSHVKAAAHLVIITCQPSQSPPSVVTVSIPWQPGSTTSSCASQHLIVANFPIANNHDTPTANSQQTQPPTANCHDTPTANCHDTPTANRLNHQLLWQSASLGSQPPHSPTAMPHQLPTDSTTNCCGSQHPWAVSPPLTNCHATPTANRLNHQLPTDSTTNCHDTPTVNHQLLASQHPMTASQPHMIVSLPWPVSIPWQSHDAGSEW
jgi:hypothetical protein